MFGFFINVTELQKPPSKTPSHSIKKMKPALGAGFRTGSWAH